MKKLILSLIIVTNLSYAGGKTFTRCFHNGEVYYTRVQMGNVPAKTCPDYVHPTENNVTKIDPVNVAQTSFDAPIYNGVHGDNPEDCTFAKERRYEDLDL